MKTYTTTQARTRFGEFISAVQRAPVRVSRRGNPVGVMVSAQDYEAMRRFYAERLIRTMNGTAHQAGLAEEQVARLLADES